MGWIVRLGLAFSIIMTLLGASIAILGENTEGGDINHIIPLIAISCVLYYLSKYDGKKWLARKKDN